MKVNPKSRKNSLLTNPSLKIFLSGCLALVMVTAGIIIKEAFIKQGEAAELPLSNATSTSQKGTLPLTTQAGVFLPGAHPPSGLPSQTTKPAYVKGEFIVKFRESLTEPADTLYNSKRQFQSAVITGQTSLDTLNARYGVKSFKPFYRPPQAAGQALSLSSPGAALRLKQAFNQHIAAIKARFPQRSRRAPKNITSPDLTRIYIAQVPQETNIEALCKDYEKDPQVEYCQPNYIMTTQALPNDTYVDPDQDGTWSQGAWGQPYEDLWGLKKIQADQTWPITQGEGITVAVVDTGLDYNHPDIAANVWVNPGEIPNNNFDDDRNGYVDDVKGWDFGNDDNDPMDGDGHGTHVSGTIAAVGNNAEGIIGVAPQAKIMPVKGMDDTGYGSIDNLAQGIRYAAENGADVINNSWGCRWACPSNPIAEDAVRYASSLGVVVIFSAGNDIVFVDFYSPQNMKDPKPVVVAASNQNDQRVDFSNFGVSVDVAAPGGGTQNYPPPQFAPFHNILSLRAQGTGYEPLAVGNDYIRLAGTSMAAPHVSGLAALILAYQPYFSPEEVRQVLRVSADDVETPGFDLKTGAGRINASRALQVDSVLSVKITSPISGSSFRQNDGPLTITGIASGSGLKEFQVFYGRGDFPSQWIPITQPVSTPVENGTLATWGISDLPDDVYLLRLVSTTFSGFQFQDVVLVGLTNNPPLQITTDLNDQMFPAISGDKIVWQDYRNNDYPDIYLYDLSTNSERRITTSGTAHYPVTSGDKIIWEDYRNSNPDIYLYDLSTNSERRITTSGAVNFIAISGDKIVWQDNRNNDYPDIYLYDLSTNSERRITTSGTAFAPAISGDKIVWQDNRNNDYPDIYLYDLSTNSERRITTSGTAFAPAISGDKIVWRNLSDIYLYDLSTNSERRITTSGAAFYAPVISGDKIVWGDNRNIISDIYLYDLSTNSEHKITTSGVAFAPAVSGDKIVWYDYYNGNWDIYLYTLPPNNPPTINPLFELSEFTFNENQQAMFRIKATDTDGNLKAPIVSTSLPLGAELTPLGDLDGDGMVTDFDVQILTDLILQGVTPTPEQDMNGDGELTALDLSILTSIANDISRVSLFLWTPTTAQGSPQGTPYNVRFFRI